MTEPLTPGEFAKALQSQRDARRRRKWVSIGVVAAAVVGLGVAVYFAFFSTVLAANNVAVEGTSLLSSDEVEVVAGVALGEPLITQDLSAVGQRVENLPAVAAVDVSRQFPDTVSIVVTERESAYLRERDGAYDWIDAEGVAFHRTSEPVQGQMLALVAEVEDQQRLLGDVAVVVANVPPEVRPEVVSIRAEATDRISLVLEGGRTIVWGSADDSPLKGEVAAALLTVEAKVYDVSAPGHPTTK